ncbi:putative F-box domain-containing protein [Tanacetum coccineum]
MTETGLDIQEEILMRLQVNDLIRCKSVCKSWYSLISSPRFAKYQLKKKVDNNEIGNTRINSLAATRVCYDEEYLVGSSNGLVCISRNATDFLVVNPSTREVKQLRNPLGEYNSSSACVSGFGYDSSIDDYKVVIGFFNKCTKKISFQVLTLKSNIWRSVDVESGYDLGGKGILCNGAIHWPDINFKKNENIEIWVMRSYNVQESWERTLLPPGYDTRKPAMRYVLREDFFILHLHIWLLEEGSGAPVLVRSIKRRCCELLDDYPHIRLCTN